MLKDNINNAEKYYNLSEGIKIGLEYIIKTNFLELQCGKYEIQRNNLTGDTIFAIVQDYYSKPISEGKLEAHRKYIDIQYIVKGEEQIGTLDIEHCIPTTQYDEAKDIIFLQPKPQNTLDFYNLHENEFIIFTQKNAHMPSIAVKNPSFVKKVVVKVLV